MKQITLLPADNYRVYNKTIISDEDKKVIIDLYQPIIGSIAVSLYFSLISDISKNVVHSHHYLMVQLKLSLNDIKKARMSLESVGLVKTLVKVDDDINNYIYQIFSPLTPYNFFNHPILNIILYNNIGEDEYNKLVNYYKEDKIDLKDYVDISETIDSVYQSVGDKKEDIINKNIGNVNIDNIIDFDFIISSIPSNLVSNKTFNKKIRELINNLAFVYNIDNLRMIDIIRLSIEDSSINREKLISNIRKYYDFNNNGNLPTLIYRTQPEYLKQNYSDTTNRGKMLYVFENTSPYDFLMGKNKGVKPTSRDLKLLEYLAVELHMKPAVINVLVDYVLRINDNKLNRSYVETIAGQWIRSRIETASSAMKIAEEEHKKNNKKVFVKDVKNVPIWFDKENDINKISDSDKEEIDNLLKDFR